MPLLKKQVNDWWNEVKIVGLGPDAAFKEGLQNFAVALQLANGLATRIGCAQKYCKGDLHIACMVYGKAANSTGQAIYEVGKGCTVDSECTTYKESKCLKQKNICVAGYPTNETAVPPTSHSKENVLLAAARIIFCPTKFNVLDHCKDQGTMNTNIARKAFLDLHNAHRAATAKGEVLMKNGKHARKCPMMGKLNYDCDLEKAAYATAQQCKPADPNTINENWFTTKTTGTNRKAAAEKAVASWYE
ncbi:hypothetical protein ANCDUO_10054 [Ancylostoma duodenale]|uniref:SCP domain-containing protein n=1 Tax=Ancylostoma duodenale TaxID=51022 RepID=A0A0C2GL74_9BILA|nr:hypothetical protein ANCDUO_10054 [Ancylostoma duodenale]